MVKQLVAAAGLLFLAGCAVPTTYTYGTQNYSSAQTFHAAANADMVAALSTVTPLPVPLTDKTLILAIPSESTRFNYAKSLFVRQTGQQPMNEALAILQNVGRVNQMGMRIYYDGLLKRNIYKSVQLIEMQAMTGEFSASPEADALYITEPAPGSAQWFYVSDKHGKQIFAADRSDPSTTGKLNAFIEAVQAQAIRE
ncbi:MAG: hypothetical protein ABWY06_11220 [Pseudomonas sp.]|uniref:hypothetical protein n=1 Tax=Pseudomonas sp. TaxID=306 RepID=UPI003390B196